MGPVLELEVLDVACPLGAGAAGDVHQGVNAAETLVGAAHRIDHLAFSCAIEARQAVVIPRRGARKAKIGNQNARPHA